MSSASRMTFRQLWWAPLACFGVAWALSLTPLVQQLEWRTLDWRTAFRVYFQKAPDPRIAVVLYGDETDGASPQLRWPPERDVHGEIIRSIALGRPKVIAFDVILDASREGDGDAKMAEIAAAAAQAQVRVVTAGVTSADPGVPAPGQEGPTRPLKNFTGKIARLVGDADAIRPFPLLRAVSAYGFADTPHEQDGVQREIPLVVRVGQQVFPSLALQTLMQFFDVSADKVRVQLGEAVYLEAKERVWRLPVSDDGKLLLNYRYDRDDSGDDFPTYSVLQVIVSANDYYIEKKKFAPKPPAFDGRIVLIGQTVTGKADAGATPRSGLTPLVLVHANLINNVLAGDFARRVPGWAVWLTALLLGWGGLLTLADRSVVVLCGGAIFGIVSYSALALWSWVWVSWWFPVTAPLLGFGSLQFIVIGRRVLQEQRQKQEIKGMFGSYLSPVIVEQMVKHRQLPQLGGHEEEITAYFSDIQGYSTFSEKLPPAQLVELLNEYLTACTDIIQEERGTLDKYIGDAVVAIFGAPIALPDHAYRACVAALRTQVKLDELRAMWSSSAQPWPAGVRQMRSRIGLNTGPATIGNMGSRTRFSYTMTGDNVNLAARMESGAKSWGVYTMCTETTRAACVQHGGDRVVFRPLGRIVVKGRTLAVPIFEVVGLREDLGAQQLECIAVFEEALAKYHARDWTGARTLFERSRDLEVNVPDRTPGIVSNPSLVYLERVLPEAVASPPPGSWDGAYVMHEK